MNQSADQSEPPLILTRYAVLVWLCAAAAIAYIQRNCIGVAAGTITSELGLTLKQMGAVLGGFFWGYAVFQIPSGWLADRWGTRRLLSLLAIAWSLATAAMALAISFEWLVTLRFLGGAAQAGIFACATRTISHWFPTTERGMTSGFLGSFMSVGAAVGANATGLLLGSFTWQSVLLIYAVPGLAWGASFYWWFRDRPEDHPSITEHLIIHDQHSAADSEPDTSKAVQEQPKPTPWWAIASSPTMWCVCGQQFFRAAGYIFYASWFTTYLLETRGVSLNQAGQLTSLPLWAVVVGSPLGGMLSDWVLARTGSRRFARSGLAVISMLGCAALIVIAYFIANVWLAVLLISAGSFCSSLGGPCAYAVTIDVGGKHVGTVFSVMNMFGNIGAAVFPILVPWLVASFGGWDVVLFVFAAVYVAAGVCWMMVHPNDNIFDRQTAREPLSDCCTLGGGVPKLRTMTIRQVDTPQSLCRFGIARCDITPPVGIYHRMWGAATHDRATGVHRPLTATALVFQAHDLPPSPNTELIVVAIDHCLLWAREMESLLESVTGATGIDKNQLVVVFSHTHSAGLMGLERVNLPGGDLIPAYLDRLTEQISQIIREARDQVQPVTICYGTGRSNLAANRDCWDEATSQFVCGFNPTSPADDTVLVARVTNLSQQPVATIVNYACHPTTLAWANTLISPDYVGAMREVVERGTVVPCVFVQGASGDLGPREGFVGDTQVADRNGRQLGFAALSALESLPPPGTRFRYTGPVISGATIGTWSHSPIDADSRRRQSAWQLRRWTQDMAYRPDLPTLAQARTDLARWQAEEATARSQGNDVQARNSRAMAERMTRLINRLTNLPSGPKFPLPITLCRIGDAVWVAVEGEYYNLLQRALRERFAGVPIIVATLANGSRPTYLPTSETYGKGVYQETIALLKPGCLEQVLKATGEAIQEMMAG